MLLLREPRSYLKHAGALVHLVHWCTGSPGAPGALVHKFTGSLVHLVYLVHCFNSSPGSPGALVHLVDRVHHAGEPVHQVHQ